VLPCSEHWQDDIVNISADLEMYILVRFGEEIAIYEKDWDVIFVLIYC
jgi:hypothetical protein